MSMEMSLMKSFSQLLSSLTYISQTLHRNTDQKESGSCSEKKRSVRMFQRKILSVAFPDAFQDVKQHELLSS